MKLSDAYYADLVLAFHVRLWLYGGILAVLAIILSGCTGDRPQNILPSMSADSQPLAEGEGDQTRNQIPHRGCDEKSDSALKKPLI
jgi:hypothetical protein